MPMRPQDLKVEHRTVEANGLRFHLVEKGQGPLVLLLHGFPENWWCWRYQIDPLVRAGYRVVAPDLRGYGETEKRGPFDLDTLSADVVALLHALGEEQAQIVSHDWGGALAWHLAAFHPGVVRRLAVFDCPHPQQMLRAFLTRPSQLLRSWYIFFFQLPLLPENRLVRDDAAVLRRMYSASAQDGSNFGDEEIRPFRDGIQKPGAARAMVGWYRAVFRRALQVARPYPVIRCPVLLGWAMEDFALGFEQLVPGTERLAPDLRVEKLEGVGHFANAEAPERVNALIEGFLTKS